MRSIEGFLAKHGEPEPAEVIAPVLTQRALREFSLRNRNAKKIETKIRFVERVLAIVTVSYAPGGSDAQREQEIQVIHGNREWAMFWIPPRQKKHANKATEPTRTFFMPHVARPPCMCLIFDVKHTDLSA